MAQKLSADVFIIGAGPAGLSAALALCRQMLRTIVFDSGEYRNAISHHMHMVPTWDHRDARDFRAASRKEILQRYNTTTFVDHRVEKLEKREDGTFQATCADGKTYTAKKTIMATGVKDVFPDIKGYQPLWGSSIFHCLFCHGYEESGGNHAGILAVDMLANSQMPVMTAATAKNLAKRVTIYTHGNRELATEIEAKARADWLDVDSRKIAEMKKVSPEASDLDLVFEDGSTDRLSFIQHMPRGVPNGPFAQQLGLEVQPWGDYKVGAPMPETTVSGVFAIGDAGNMMKSVCSAINSGSISAGAVTHAIAMESMELH